MAHARQLSLPEPRTRGGRRRGAGRKPGPRPIVQRVTRPLHVARHPLHLTLRRRRELPSLRTGDAFTAVKGALARASNESFRVLHFSVQRDHIHLIAEAADRRALSRGFQGLAVRVAKAINRVLGRRGSVWGDRYHARPLKTPREVRNAISYVLNNWRKHISDTPAGVVDRCSSGRWFNGWSAGAVDARDPSPVVCGQTWLATIGWRRCGLLRVDERPGDPAAPALVGGCCRSGATLIAVHLLGLSRGAFADASPPDAGAVVDWLPRCAALIEQARKDVAAIEPFFRTATVIAETKRVLSNCNLHDEEFVVIEIEDDQGRMLFSTSASHSPHSEPPMFVPPHFWWQGIGDGRYHPPRPPGPQLVAEPYRTWKDGSRRLYHISDRQTQPQLQLVLGVSEMPAHLFLDGASPKAVARIKRSFQSALEGCAWIARGAPARSLPVATPTNP